MFGNTGINDFGFGVRRISNLRGTVQGLESQWNAEERERRRREQEREQVLNYEVKTRHAIDKANERQAAKQERERDRVLDYENRTREAINKAFDRQAARDEQRKNMRQRAAARQNITHVIVDDWDVQTPKGYDTSGKPFYGKTL